MSDSESYDSSLSDDEQEKCPMCGGIMDETDLQYYPCPCNYQVCLFCLKQLKESGEPCPRCKRKYDEKNCRVESRRSNKKHRKPEINTLDDKQRNNSPRNLSAEEMRDLQTVRVIQKNLVYVVGLPLDSSSDSTIRRKDMFGQYGHIMKIVVNNRNPIGDKSSTCGVYITYETNEQAYQCIICVDGFTFCGKLLKASYGTTKYCFNFTKGQKCTNSECMYLHHFADKEDCFTKEEMTTRQVEFYKITHPGNGSQWDDRLHKYVYKKTSDDYVTSLPSPIVPALRLVTTPKKVKSVTTPLQSSQSSRKTLSPSYLSTSSSHESSSSNHMNDVCKYHNEHNNMVLFSFTKDQAVETNVAGDTELLASLNKLLPYTFDKLGSGINGSIFGLVPPNMTVDEEININRLIDNGSFLQKSSEYLHIGTRTQGESTENGVMGLLCVC